ncbi:MAG: nucleotide exchange factor GrpE [Candidatus Eremiobacteraeota bacterium]|nr:nucleotide exchange factor GrpE [Candidatus Eremiobacteraeota bacterium]
MDINTDTTAAQDPAPQGDLTAELVAAKAKADENYNKFLYAMADFENYKKRIERQFADIASAGKRSLVERLLPVVDNLERALAHDADAEVMRKGLEQTLRGFEAVLSGEGVRAYSVLGQRFDPTLAEAIGTQTPEPGVADDTVVQEAQKGYKYGDEVLRPAKVIVAKA